VSGWGGVPIGMREKKTSRVKKAHGVSEITMTRELNLGFGNRNKGGSTKRGRLEYMWGKRREDEDLKLKTGWKWPKGKASSIVLKMARGGGKMGKMHTASKAKEKGHRSQRKGRKRNRRNRFTKISWVHGGRAKGVGWVGGGGRR